MAFCTGITNQPSDIDSKKVILTQSGEQCEIQGELKRSTVEQLQGQSGSTAFKE